MSDLISREALLRKLCEWSNKLHPSNSKQFTLSEFEWLVNNQPTAYDVDKVVSKIEIMCSEYNESICDTYNSCEPCVIGKAIEIVKGGGINE